MTEKVLPAPAHTPDTVLERVVADLALSVGDLAMAHAVDGFQEIAAKLHGIAQCAARAIRDLHELNEQGDFERMAAEADRSVALDARRAG